MKKSTKALGCAIAASALVLTGACGSSSDDSGDKGTKVASIEDMDALVAAAKDEGQLTLYSSSVETIDGSIIDAFKKKYGITVNSTKLTSAEVTTRYVSEASAGRVLADILATTCTDDKGMREVTSKGWATPAKDLGIPVLDGDGASALVSDGAGFKYDLTPVVIGYNTDKVKKQDAPTSWEDLIKPEYKGKIVMVDPGSSAFYDSWLQWLADEYGDDYIKALGKQELRYADAATARNQLGAGEHEIDIPTFQVSMEDTASTGAPVASSLPAKTSANESCIVVSSAKDAPHPNAALLYAYFITTDEGIKALTEGPGGILSPFSPGVADKVTPLPAKADSAKLHDLLGFKG